MAASVKKQWFLAKYARFVCDDETENFVDHNNLAETLDVPCKGRWKVYCGNNKDLLLYYLESEHLLIISKDVILESFSLINSKLWFKGVAKRDSILIVNKLKNGNDRRFRIQFEKTDDEMDGYMNRKECSELLVKYFPICDYDHQIQKDVNYSEVVDINQDVLNKLQFRKAYTVDAPKEYLKEILLLCLTDTTFPSFVAEVNETLKNIGK